MAAKKSKAIDEIDDVGEMFQAMAALGISCHGLKTLEEMRDRVKTELKQSPSTPSWTAGQLQSFFWYHKDSQSSEFAQGLFCFFKSKRRRCKEERNIINVLLRG